LSRLLIDIGHPAHVHLFRYLATALHAKGWEVLFSVRAKGENVELLKDYGLPFEVYGTSRKSFFSKIFSAFQKKLALYQILKKFKPTLTISHGSFYLSQVSWFYRVPNITLEDTGNMEQILLYLPFTNAILTPESYHRNHGKKQIRYNGFHETAYIYPDILKQAQANNLSSPDTVLIRLVDWTASHDLGQEGLSSSVISQLIRIVDDQSKIKILSEKPLPENLKLYSLDIPPHQLHEFLRKVKLYVGEGATLASECAHMGIPAIYVNSRSAGVIQAQVKAALLFHFTTSEGVVEKAIQLLSDPSVFSQHQIKAVKFLENNINLSKLLEWFIESWPESFRIMKENPEYQNNFK